MAQTNGTPDDERHEDDGRRDEHDRENATALEGVPPLIHTGAGPGCVRLHRTRPILNHVVH